MPWEDDPEQAKAFGNRIRELRKALGLSMGVAANRAGITSARWSAVENASLNNRTGRPSMPSVPLIKSMADALDADRVELLELAGQEAAAAYERARLARSGRTEVAAAGGDLERLRQQDPAAYEGVMSVVRSLLDRADEREP